MIKDNIPQSDDNNSTILEIFYQLKDFVDCLKIEIVPFINSDILDKFNCSDEEKFRAENNLNELLIHLDAFVTTETLKLDVASISGEIKIDNEEMNIIKDVFNHTICVINPFDTDLHALLEDTGYFDHTSLEMHLPLKRVIHASNELDLLHDMTEQSEIITDNIKHSFLGIVNRIETLNKYMKKSIIDEQTQQRFNYIGKILACEQVLKPEYTDKISIFFDRHPEYENYFIDCQEYIDGLEIEDIKKLKNDYIESAIEPNSKPLTITRKLFKDPHANTSAFFGGFFLEQKPLDSKLSNSFEKANDEIRKAIERLFEDLCAGGYLERRIEVLHAFVYKLTQYRPYGKEVEMKTIKWMSGNSGDINPLLYCAKEAFGINQGYKKDYFERAHSIFELDKNVKWPKKPTSRIFEHSTPDIQKACNIFVTAIGKTKERYQKKVEDYKPKAEKSKK